METTDTRKRLLRLSSFLTKEIIDVLRQPRLVVTLILGPFLILLLFGLGFTGDQPPVEAIVVIPPGAELPPNLLEKADRYRNFLPIREVTSSEGEAVAALKEEQVDLVAVLPAETYSALLDGRQIVVTLLINEIDPLRDDYLTYISNFLVAELNKEILRDAARQGKALSSELREFSVDMLDEVILLGEDLERGDVAQAQERLDGILEDTTYEAGSVGSSSQALLGVGAVLVALGAPPEDLERIRRAQVSMQELRDELEKLDRDLERDRVDLARQLRRLRAVRSTLSELQSTADLLDQIPTDVLVSPLTTTTENVSRFQPNYLGFYAPAVLALLLQHMAVTFSALTLVRERLLGASELFRVAPIAPWEIITGKYLSYGILTLGIAAVLSFLIIIAMGVPLFGSVIHFTLVLVLLTLFSLGWGFLISLFSHRESQAVQFAMLILIASVFFGGFFLPISALQPPVRVISYALPVTYAIQALQAVMLAGRPPAVGELLWPAGLGLLLYAGSVAIYTWQHKKE